MCRNGEKPPQVPSGLMTVLLPVPDPKAKARSLGLRLEYYFSLKVAQTVPSQAQAPQPLMST
jgi:hypothetical protein